MPAVLAGALLGFLSGMGAGGGSLLVVFLTLYRKQPPEICRTMGLLFFLPAALVSSAFRLKRGAVSPGKVLPGIAAGCLSAGLCSVLWKNKEPDWLFAAYGCFLLAAGVRELFYRERKFR